MTFSNHIGSSSELLVLADIKPGFVPIRSPNPMQRVCGGTLSCWMRCGAMVWKRIPRVPMSDQSIA